MARADVGIGVFSDPYTGVPQAAEPMLQILVNKEEALFLHDILGRIGGCPKKSRRRIADEILDKMKETQFVPSEEETLIRPAGDIDWGYRLIYFTNEDEDSE